MISNDHSAAPIDAVSKTSCMGYSGMKWSPRNAATGLSVVLTDADLGTVGIVAIDQG